MLLMVTESPNIPAFVFIHSCHIGGDCTFGNSHLFHHVFQGSPRWAVSCWNTPLSSTLNSKCLSGPLLRMPKADTEISSCFFLRMAPDIQVWSGDRQALDLDFLSSLIFVRERRHAPMGHNRKITSGGLRGGNFLLSHSCHCCHPRLPPSSPSTL